MTIRPMTHGDIADGLRLCRASNWNQLEDDWRVFLDHGGAFVALEDGEIVGTVAHLPFRDAFTWLSMMLVDPARRRSGIGAQLMEVCLDATGPDVCVRLDATPLGEPLYRRFGFVDEYRLARTSAIADGRPCAGARPISPSDLPRIAARDREVFGADRGLLLADLLRRAPDLAWQSDHAYCFGRPGYIRPQIGPLIADDAPSARELLRHVFSTRAGAAFTLDIPVRADGLDLAAERPFLRMRRGIPRSAAGDSSQVFAITGPEFG